MPAGLLIEMGKPGKGDKPDADEEMMPDSKSDGGDSYDAALDDAFDAVSAKDKAAFKSAMRAAITACCADMMAEEK